MAPTPSKGPNIPAYPQGYYTYMDQGNNTVDEVSGLNPLKASTAAHHPCK